MPLCYLGLGSNLSIPKRQLNLALRALRELPQTRITNISPFYHSQPAGVTGQPIYCNAVVEIKTTLEPHTLLSSCQTIENKQQRLRKKRWGARTLDIDLLLYGNQVIQTHDLVIPHPRLHLRDFVLKPLLDIWPHARLPDGTCLSRYLQAMTQHHILEAI